MCVLLKYLLVAVGSFWIPINKRECIRKRVRESIDSTTMWEMGCWCHTFLSAKKHWCSIKRSLGFHFFFVFHMFPIVLAPTILYKLEQVSFSVRKKCSLYSVIQLHSKIHYYSLPKLTTRTIKLTHYSSSWVLQLKKKTK